MYEDDHVTTEFEAKTPRQLGEEISRADSVKLKFDEEVYSLTRLEIGWIVAALTISNGERQSG